MPAAVAFALLAATTAAAAPRLTVADYSEGEADRTGPCFVAGSLLRVVGSGFASGGHARAGGRRVRVGLE